jgi:hypothetical protein
MSELRPDEPRIAAAGADPDRREAAPRGVRGVQTAAETAVLAATSLPIGPYESQFRASLGPFTGNRKLGTT